MWRVNMQVVSEQEFSKRLEVALFLQGGDAKSVTGPGRSGAIASVYASHKLSIPWIPYGQNVPDDLKPVLVIDTAELSGRTLRKAMRRYDTELGLAVFKQPPRVKFWYERV
jgi:hypothetical protein